MLYLLCLLGWGLIGLIAVYGTVTAHVYKAYKRGYDMDTIHDGFKTVHSVHIDRKLVKYLACICELTLWPKAVYNVCKRAPECYKEYELITYENEEEL